MIDFDLSGFIRTHVTKRPESLLAADFARYGDELEARLAGKRVLVIGGAGSIGSEYVKAILRFPIGALYVVDINENGLTELVRDLRSTEGCRIPEEFVPYPVNFGDGVFEKLFAAHGPFDVVANFAAHKHVRSEKDIFSIEAMTQTNVFYARKLLDMLVKAQPEHFFCVSTDKAANPVNIMGATKKLMEETVLAYAEKFPVTTARFANVAFSNGSLPQGWLRRIEKRQPLSCPKGIRRFFVSPQESGELCLMASILGENGTIMYPKLNPEKDMITFENVVRDLMTTLGYGIRECANSEEARQAMRGVGSPIRDHSCHSRTGYPVEFFASETDGEKTFEEFYTDSETRDTSRFVNLGVIVNPKHRSFAEVDRIFASLRSVFAKPVATKEDVVAVLDDYLPNFHHIEKGKGLDSRM